MHRVGSCPASPGACFGSAPRQKERIFRCIPVSILPGAWGQGGGEPPGRLLSALFMGCGLRDSAQEKVTTGGHLWEARQRLDFIFSNLWGD